MPARHLFIAIPNSHGRNTREAELRRAVSAEKRFAPRGSFDMQIGNAVEGDRQCLIDERKSRAVQNAGHDD